MEWLIFLAYLGSGITAGALTVFSTNAIRRQRRKSAAQRQAEQLLTGARTRAENLLAGVQKSNQEYENRLRLRSQKEVGQKQQRLKNVEQDLRNQQSQQDKHFAELDREFQNAYGPVLKAYESCQKRSDDLDQRREKAQTLRMQLVGQCESLSSQNRTEVIKTLVDRSVEDGLLHARRRYQAWEEDTKLRAEQMSHQILGTVLSRFPREYCPERGIGIVAIPSEQSKQRLVSNDREILRRLGELCGVDLTVQENNTIAVSGFDPVRRELTTRCLEKIVATKDISMQRIERIVDDTKKDLFRRIENDGRLIAKELHQENLHPEIQRMLGSLRYRYSYAQNQYFHVGEVGWLCGLLSAELGDSISDGKRAGLLHDVGKAMDHSIEGGHAVIGADFIHQHGEAPHIVHAVRSHHFEEQPATDLAFLVIAADAISGARPGARRSTVTAYNQKMEALETIGDSHFGVLRTLVFNAGREVRLVVDSHKVSDREALALCRDIATTIENDLTYPGTIKVVVVRETVAEALAK